MRPSIVLLVLVVVLAMFEVGAVKCYKCHTGPNKSDNNADCNDPDITDCGKDIGGCWNIFRQQNGAQVIMKMCGLAGSPWQGCIPEDGQQVCRCLGDFCNMSNRPEDDDYTKSSDFYKSAARRAHKPDSGTATVLSLGLFVALLLFA
ncbi:hypothetical protein M3Y94_00986800 [Aphelenchoides besseyi]|nr:hypothetical protein M3Y94_00986800 [Aphelenchoides besseyi]KAI6221110.1 hypothetical protein M3Y95_01006300 [Aphelenchoides besseyi]